VTQDETGICLGVVHKASSPHDQAFRNSESYFLCYAGDLQFADGGNNNSHNTVKH